MIHNLKTDRGMLIVILTSVLIQSLFSSSLSYKAPFLTEQNFDSLDVSCLRQVVNVVVNEVDFNPEFISHMIPKMEWSALL